MKPGEVFLPRFLSRGTYVVVKEATDEAVKFTRFTPPYRRKHPTDNGVSEERVRRSTFDRRYEALNG